MHFFKTSKQSSQARTTTTTTLGDVIYGDGGWSSSPIHEEPSTSTSTSTSRIAPAARTKHKSMDMSSFLTFSNFLTRSVSKKVPLSPERVPRRNNEFDTPGFLSRNRSITKKIERSLSRSKSAAKGENGNFWEVNDKETKAAHRRSQSTTRRSDWLSGFAGCRDEESFRSGKSVGDSSGPSRSKTGAINRKSNAGDGGSGSSRIGGAGAGAEMEEEEGSRRSKSTMRQRPQAEDSEGSSRSRSRTRRRPESMSGPLPLGGGRRTSIPIMFSNSKGKPPPVEKTLDCSLEELLAGCVKKILLTRDVVFGDGTISKEEETVRIKVKPGWKQGTKITFEGMGDEQPGMLPADIIFSVAETRHNLYRREGDDLVMAIEIPLVKALTGCNLSIPLLGGGTTGVRINEVIHPGYERVLLGQGMPSSKDKAVRGNLCLRFHVAFPDRLSPSQRTDLYTLLLDT